MQATACAALRVEWTAPKKVNIEEFTKAISQPCFNGPRQRVGKACIASGAAQRCDAAASNVRPRRRAASK